MRFPVLLFEVKVISSSIKTQEDAGAWKFAFDKTHYKRTVY